jgi:hypothetical protein
MQAGMHTILAWIQNTCRPYIDVSPEEIMANNASISQEITKAFLFLLIVGGTAKTEVWHSGYLPKEAVSHYSYNYR